MTKRPWVRILAEETIFFAPFGWNKKQEEIMESSNQFNILACAVSNPANWRVDFEAGLDYKFQLLNWWFHSQYLKWDEVIPSKTEFNFLGARLKDSCQLLNCKLVAQETIFFSWIKSKKQEEIMESSNQFGIIACNPANWTLRLVGI